MNNSLIALKNIGLKDDELYSNIRVTLGSINNKSEIKKFLELFRKESYIFEGFSKIKVF